MLLPPHIEANFHEHAEVASPMAALRGLTDMSGALGESYLLSDGKRLHVHSRTVGRDWQSLVIPLPPDMAAEVVKPYVFLRGTGPKDGLEFKFSSYEADAVDAFLASFSGGAAAEDPEVEAAVAAPSAMTLFAAALHAMAQADLVVEEAESATIRRSVSDEATIRAGYLLWQRIGTQALIDRMRDTFDADQRLCLLANMIELGMADGTLRSIENETVRWFRKELDVDKDAVRGIFDALVVKNRVAVFAEE